MENPSPRRLWPLLLFAVCSLLALWPALLALHKFCERYDWRYFEALTEMSRRAVVFYHELPMWNPYSCGGEVGIANPQSLDAAPTFLLILLFGTAAGYKLSLVLYAFLAMTGTYLLCRKYSLSVLPATVAAVAYGLNGYHALHFSAGHVSFLGVTLFPLLLYCYERALDEAQWVIPTGLCSAWIAVLGGTFTPPLAAELLLLWGVLCSIERRSLRPLALLVLSALVALLSSAIRMLPVLEFVTDHPRPPFLRAPDRSSLVQVLRDLVAWREFGPVPGRKYWSHEYAGRIPLVVAPLSLVGLPTAWLWKSGDPQTRSLRAVSLRLTLLAVFGLLLSMGNFAPLAPWSLLQKLPILRDLRVPSRHLVLLDLPLCLLAGFSLEWIWKEWERAARPGKRILQVAFSAVLFVAAVDGIAYTAVQYQSFEITTKGLRLDRPIFNVNAELPSGPVPFYFVNGTWQYMRETFFSGHGSVAGGAVKVGYDCDEVAPLQRAQQLDAGPVPQEKLQDTAAGEIVDSKWSPSQRIVTVDLKSPTVLLVNSNWNEHWKVDHGNVIKVAGQLAVDLAGLPPGRHTLHIRYAPRSFAIGAVLTALSLPLFGLLFFRARRRPKKESP